MPPEPVVPELVCVIYLPLISISLVSVAFVITIDPSNVPIPFCGETSKPNLLCPLRVIVALIEYVVPGIYPETGISEVIHPGESVSGGPA